MITLTRDEAQKLLDSLLDAVDAQQWELDNHIKTYGEWFRPARVEYMRDVLNSTRSMIEVLSHKLTTLGPILPGGGGGSGEPTIDGWPLYSGLPQPDEAPSNTKLHYWAVVIHDTGKTVEGWCETVDLYLDGKRVGVPREWVGFTQEEHQFAMRTDSSFFAGFLYAEKLLKEKNT